MLITQKGGLSGLPHGVFNRSDRHWCHIIFLTLHFVFFVDDLFGYCAPCSHIVFLALSSVCVVAPDQVSNPCRAE